MPPPPLSSDEAARIAALERWRKEHEAEHRREREEIRREVEDMTSAAVRHVEHAVAEGLAPVKLLAGDVAVIKAQNAAQTEILSEAAAELRLARDERIKRAAAEEALAAKKKSEDDERARVKADVELDVTRKDARTRRIAAWIALAVAVLGVLGGLITAAIASHK